MVIKIHFDGACHNIPGENNDMGIGVAVFFDGEYQEEYSQAKFVKYEFPLGTSNIAEWTACHLAIKTAVDLRKVLPGCEIHIYSDSQLISYQYNGKYAVKKEEFRSFFELARKCGEEAKIKTINWIPREENTKADELSKIGLKECKPDKKYWYLHDESDSCFIATEKELEEMSKTSPSDFCQIKEVELGETEKDADRIWDELQAGRLKKVYV